MQDTFLPVDFELPAKSNWRYTRFWKGETTKIRILSNAIVGYEYFTNDNRPIRQKEIFKWIPADSKEQRAPKLFWAFICYNYNTEQIEICEITQRSIMEAILNLKNDPDFWDPVNTYDLKITRQGESLQTKYTVLPWNKEKLDQKIMDEYENNTIVLNALYEWKDPFNYDFNNL